MTTLTKTHERFNTNTQTVNHSSRYDLFIKKIEFSYFAFIAMSILISSCLGGVTTMKIFENNAPLWMFILSITVTMANLVSCLAQAPMKWVVNLFTLSLIVNILLLVANLI